MTPDFWKYRRACKIVHEFSMDVIKKRRAVLEEKKVSEYNTYDQHLMNDVIATVNMNDVIATVNMNDVIIISSHSRLKKKNEDTLNGTKRKYRDFLDILLEARVSGPSSYCRKAVQ